MTASAPFRMTHSILIRKDPQTVYGMITDVAKWPEIFPPCRAASLVSRQGDSMTIEITAQVGDGVRTWQSRRTLDVAAMKVGFEQVKSFAPIRSMTGYWEVRPERGVGCTVVLVHDFVVGPDGERFHSAEAAEEWIRETCDRNSES